MEEAHVMSDERPQGEADLLRLMATIREIAAKDASKAAECRQLLEKLKTHAARAEGQPGGTQPRGRCVN